jgi:S1-C subfamily serine protease
MLAAASAAASPPVSDSADLRAKTEALARASRAVVGVRAIAVEDARSSASLGRARQGSGVVIGDDGLVLTIGYLILEADHVEVVLDGRRVIPARVVAYDLASGFGLLQPLAPVHLPPARLGSSSALQDDEPLLIASGGEDGDLSVARMVSRRPFSGYWEYHIDGALFTAPPRTDHSGAGLFNANGELLGIGSLLVLDALGPDKPRMPGNMFVPIDLLKPILPELRTRGATRASTRPWLGLNCVEIDGIVRVVRTAPDSPAEEIGLRPGDQIVRIDDVSVDGLEGLYKTLWRGDAAEREVTLVIRRGSVEQTLQVRTQDRMKTLRRAQGI